jgi:hypothetical protein
MNKNQKDMWDMLQGNNYHEWIAAELIAPPITEKRPFFDPVMTAGFVLIAVVAVFNIFL